MPAPGRTPEVGRSPPVIWGAEEPAFAFARLNFRGRDTLFFILLIGLMFPAQVTILPIPYEQTTTYGTGTKEGPQAIIAASRHMELYDEELDYEVYKVGLHTLPELEPVVSGPKAPLGSSWDTMPWPACTST